MQKHRAFPCVCAGVIIMLSVIHKNQVDATLETQSEYADPRMEVFLRLNTFQPRLFNAVQHAACFSFSSASNVNFNLGKLVLLHRLF